MKIPKTEPMTPPEVPTYSTCPQSFRPVAYVPSFSGRLAALWIVIPGLSLTGHAPAAVSITLGPYPSLDSTGLNPKQTAVADTISLVPVANFSALLQSVLNAQGFTAANNWTVNNINLLVPLSIPRVCLAGGLAVSAKCVFPAAIL